MGHPIPTVIDICNTYEKYIIPVSTPNTKSLAVTLGMEFGVTPSSRDGNGFWVCPMTLVPWAGLNIGALGW